MSHDQGAQKTYHDGEQACKIAYWGRHSVRYIGCTDPYCKFYRFAYELTSFIHSRTLFSEIGANLISRLLKSYGLRNSVSSGVTSSDIWSTTFPPEWNDTMPRSY